MIFTEIKVPKEIRAFHESVFFGLSMRQFICSLIGVAAAVGVYFGLADVLGRETVSWLCVLAATPFTIAGFFSYNGMTLEKFLLAWVRSEFLCAGPRKFVAENFYIQMLCDIDGKRKGAVTARLWAKILPRDKETHGVWETDSIDYDEDVEVEPEPASPAPKATRTRIPKPFRRVQPQDDINIDDLLNREDLYE